MVAGVHVAAPATSANLGPGFDAAGLALDWWDTLQVEVEGAGPSRAPAAIRLEGAAAGGLPTGAGNLVWQAMAALAEAASAPLPEVRLTVSKGFPLGRGFGSSAAAVTLGLLAARALVAPGTPDAAVLELAAKLEGHADNVAPCLHGGATLTWTGTSGPQVATLPVHRELAAVALVASSPLSTGAARAALPGQVPFILAARTAGRAALLAPALAGQFELLLPATDDQLHQPTRLALDAGAAHAVTALRDRGHAAFLSGAGPSVLALTPRDRLETLHGDAEAVVGELAGWRTRPVALARSGALATVRVQR